MNSLLKKFHVMTALSFLNISYNVMATEPVPIQFKDGDVISAAVINELLQRLNDVTIGFPDTQAFNGVWSCTTYSTNSAGCTAAGNLLYKKTGIITFDGANKTFNYSGTGDPRGCFVGGYLTSGQYDVQDGYLVTSYGVYEARKQGNDKFLWTLNSANPPNGYTVCERQNIPPAPVDLLTATVTGTTAFLTWVDQSTNETGFKVQRKTADTAWTTIATPAAGATAYNDTGLTAGTYFYRVFAVNADGDSISSSEVQAVVVEAQ